MKTQTPTNQLFLATVQVRLRGTGDRLSDKYLIKLVKDAINDHLQKGVVVVPKEISSMPMIFPLNCALLNVFEVHD